MGYWWEYWLPSAPPENDLQQVSTGVLIDAALILLQELARRGIEVIPDPPPQE